MDVLSDKTSAVGNSENVAPATVLSPRKSSSGTSSAGGSGGSASAGASCAGASGATETKASESGASSSSSSSSSSDSLRVCRHGRAYNVSLLGNKLSNYSIRVARVVPGSGGAEESAVFEASAEPLIKNMKVPAEFGHHLTRSTFQRTIFRWIQSGSSKSPSRDCANLDFILKYAPPTFAGESEEGEDGEGKGNGSDKYDGAAAAEATKKRFTQQEMKELEARVELRCQAQNEKDVDLMVSEFETEVSEKERQLAAATKERDGLKVEVSRLTVALREGAAAHAALLKVRIR